MFPEYKISLRGMGMPLGRWSAFAGTLGKMILNLVWTDPRGPANVFLIDILPIMFVSPSK